MTTNSGDDEWYTDAKYIKSARKVMGEIDLDPASSETANMTVKATTYYTIEDDGLSHEWRGRIWLIPPFSRTGIFVSKLLESNFTEAIVFVNNSTETGWFQSLFGTAGAAVFPQGRTSFYRTDGSKGGKPLQGQVIIYLGPNPNTFVKEFSKYGLACKPVRKP